MFEQFALARIPGGELEKRQVHPSCSLYLPKI